MKRVLVTGGNGFVGRHVVPMLTQAGYEVHATTTRKDEPAMDGVIWYQIDLLNLKATKELVSVVRPSHLMHLAWYVEPGKYWTSLENFHWVQASLSLMEEFSAQGGKRAVVAGSCTEYDWNHKILSEATTPCSPKSQYSTCKHALYSLLTSFSKTTETSFGWGRLFYLFGPHEHSSRLVPSVVKGLLENEIIECSEGKQLRDFLFVGDVASALAAFLGSPVEGAVNIGSGKAVSIRDLVGAISRKIGNEDLVHFGARPTAENEPLEFAADIKRLTEEVGWRPQYTLEEALDLTIQWWQSVLSRDLK